MYEARRKQDQLRIQELEGHKVTIEGLRLQLQASMDAKKAAVQERSRLEAVVDELTDKQRRVSMTYQLLHRIWLSHSMIESDI